MNQKITAAFFIFVSLATPMALSEDAERSIFELLHGEWRSNEPAFGAPATSWMNWAPTLDGKYFRLDYRIEIQPQDGVASTFQGVAYYRTTDGDVYQAFWADNSGDFHPITANRAGNALIAHWGVDGGKQGRTRYEFSAAGNVKVTDWIKTQDGWKQFNHNIFERSVSDR